MIEDLSGVGDVDAVLAVQRRAATALLLLTGTYLGSIGPVAVTDEALVEVDRALVDLGDYFDLLSSLRDRRPMGGLIVAEFGDVGLRRDRPAGGQAADG